MDKKWLEFWYGHSLKHYEEMARLFPDEMIWEKAVSDTKKRLELLAKKEGREALVSVHQDEAVGSPQSQDAQSRVKSPPPSTEKKGDSQQ